MGMITRVSIIMMLLTACAGTPEPKAISKARWVECWTLCGKADNLAAASELSCLCRNGMKVERDEPKPEIKTFEMFEWLIK